MEDKPESIALKFEHVTVSFDEPALDDVSFEVPAGDTRVLFGAAGAGKTVLLKTALGLLKPDSGRIFIFGQEITRMREQELFDVRSKIGMLFQESALFDSMTIEDNVAYPLLNQKAIRTTPEDAENRVRDTLHFVDLDDTESKFPSELSGGMRRRVGVARAVVTNPPLIRVRFPHRGTRSDHGADHHQADHQTARCKAYHHAAGDSTSLPEQDWRRSGPLSLRAEDRFSL